LFPFRWWASRSTERESPNSLEQIGNVLKKKKKKKTKNSLEEIGTRNVWAHTQRRRTLGMCTIHIQSSSHQLPFFFLLKPSSPSLSLSLSLFETGRLGFRPHRAQTQTLDPPLSCYPCGRRRRKKEKYFVAIL
jgi:hypothetical protein